MTSEMPARARQLVSKLAALLESDSELAKRLNDAQSRLQDANGQLWSGLHPDALGLLYDDTHQVAIGQGGSVIADLMIDALREGGGEREVETAVLPKLQQTHWTIHRAFVDYQSAWEERRQLAARVGETGHQLTDALTAAGWSEDAARNANVHELAAAKNAS